MVLRRVASGMLLCLGAAFALILLSPSSASACGQVNYKDGGSGGALQCPSGPDETGIGIVGGGIVVGTFAGGVWTFTQGGRAAGRPLARTQPSSPPEAGPEPLPNPYRRPQRQPGDPNLGKPTEEPEGLTNETRETVDNVRDVVDDATGATLGLVQMVNHPVTRPVPIPSATGAGVDITQGIVIGVQLATMGAIRVIRRVLDGHW